MSLKRLLLTSCILAALLFAPALHAATTVSSIIGNNMVLQRNAPVVLWGWDDAGTKVTVGIGKSSATATAGDDGSWAVSLPAMKAGGPHEIAISGSSKITLKNVLVGEVWLCSGQSNMEWTVARSLNPKEEIAAGTHPTIRHIKFPHKTSDKPLANAVTEGWTETTPQSVANYTAVGYYFARNLQKELGVPVGLIGCNWGGTRIEPWTPPAGFKAVPALKEISDNLASFPKKNDKGAIQHQTALAIYNAMVHPILPYRFKGALWYQGESNNGEGMLYHEKMKALIHGWRKVFNHPEMPFHFVQLAPYRYNRPEALPGIWQAQLKTLAIKNTGMAVTVDIGNTRDIHPKNKQEVGRRLALWSLTKDYGRDVGVYSGPLLSKVDQVEGKGSITVHFHKETKGGLKTSDGKPVSHFEIAGKDGKWQPAKATIVFGDHLMVRSKDVKEPVHVRYGWNELAEPNLVNGAGLPASPFQANLK